MDRVTTASARTASKVSHIDQAKTNELARAKRSYAHRTWYLVSCAEAGLLEAAEQELRSLLKANPDSEVAKVCCVKYKHFDGGSDYALPVIHRATERAIPGSASSRLHARDTLPYVANDLLWQRSRRDACAPRE
jgi:hypothetical protein